MNWYWTSWISGNYEAEGCTAPPFKFWVTGSVFRKDYGMLPPDLAKYNELLETDELQAEIFLGVHGKDDVTICANIQAESEEKVWELVKKHFPDCKERFINPSEEGYPKNNSRFQ